MHHGLLPGEAKIHVVHLIESLGMAGAERRLVSDLQWLDRTRYDHRVIYLTPADALRGEIEALGVPTVWLGMRSLREWWIGFVQLVSILRDWRPRLLHTQVFGADVYGRLAAAAAGVPVVVSTVQTIPYDRQLARFFSRKRVVADRLTARFLTHRFVAVSDAVREALISGFGIPSSRIRVIPNGVDLARFSPGTPEQRAQARASLGLPQAAYVLLAVGRLIPEKDHATLLRAFRRVADHLADARLLLIGDGPLRSELDRLVQTLGLADRTAFLGTRTDVPQLLHAVDLFVLPSIREGLPVALLEAMASAVPVVASAIPQNQAVIQAGQTGWLIPLGDHETLAEAALRAARNPAEAHAVGRRGREQVVTHFSAETCAHQLQALYDELCVPPPSRDGAGNR